MRIQLRTRVIVPEGLQRVRCNAWWACTRKSEGGVSKNDCGGDIRLSEVGSFVNREDGDGGEEER